MEPQLIAKGAVECLKEKAMCERDNSFDVFIKNSKWSIASALAVSFKPNGQSEEPQFSLLQPAMSSE